MRVLCCGDREWKNQDRIRYVLSSLRNIEVVIEGECRGADLLSRAVAEALHLPVLRFPADWDRYGKVAGPVRNQRMLDEGKPDLVVAFHNNLQESKGTRDMVNRARAASIKVMIVTEKFQLRLFGGNI